MKWRTRVVLFGLVAMGAVALPWLKRGANPGRAPNAGACCLLIAALDAKPVAAGTSPVTPHATAQPVIAYYFHGTLRCDACLQIEAQAQAVIEQQFSADLAADRLMFISLNYDLPENAHFLTDFKLPCPSLVLVRRTAGHAEKWKLLGDTWQRVQDPPRLNRYLAAEIRSFLSGREQQAGTNPVELPPAPDHR